jgi:NOL1/NOP2/fmu family ribosome biogenesis protein
MSVQREIEELLQNQFGFKTELLFKEMGKRRIYVYRECPLDIQAQHYGIYFGRIEKDGLRLSIEGSYIVGRSAERGVIEVNDDVAKRWMMGDDIENDVKGYVIIKWGNYILGCGKGNGTKIRNYIPKDRRV